MPLITLYDAALAFGHHALLDKAELVLESGERVGLIGRNGGGKTSLLRVLAGETVLDDGRLWLQPGLRVGYVPQEPPLELDETVFEAVAGGLGPVQATLTEYGHLAARLETHPADSDAIMERLHVLGEALEASDGWRLQSRVDSTLSHLSLNPEVRVGDLSGGWRKRVALARALVSEPDLLLLDEPTNHLDIAAIEWLEEFLRAFRGSIVFITHDRRFLDRVTTRILELDRGRLTEFGASYAEYQRRKADQLEVEATQAAKFDKFLAEEEVWIRKGVQARRTRNEGRVLRLESLRRARAARRERMSEVRLAVDTGERSGELVCELKNVSVRFGERTIIRNFSTRLLRGDKIGVIGPNGAGKTTLLRVILGDLEPTEGTVKQGSRLTYAYFDQLRAQLDPEATLADSINPGADFVEIAGVRKHVVSYLGDFLFPPERVRAKVKSLSGGERNRLLLARLFTQPANVLILDEPTNDLDMETLDLLEALLAEYTGTLFLVSHDRAFLDNVVTEVIALDGDGNVMEMVGGYADWAKYQAQQTAGGATTAGGAGTPGSMASAVASIGSAGASVAKPPAAPKPAASKLKFKEVQELEALPTRIEALEGEQQSVAAQLADPEVYRAGGDALLKLQARSAALEKELHATLERWEWLESRK